MFYGEVEELMSVIFKGGEKKGRMLGFDEHFVCLVNSVIQEHESKILFIT